MGDEPLAFVITRPDASTVLVTWNKPLGLIPRDGHYLDLAVFLEDIAGVDEAEVRRYSARVTVATHVTTPGAVVEQIHALLTWTPEGAGSSFAEALGWDFEAYTVEVR